MTKQEKKALKWELFRLSVEEYQQLKQEHARYSSKADSLSTAAEDLSENMAERDTELEELRTKVSQLERKIKDQEELIYTGDPEEFADNFVMIRKENQLQRQQSDSISSMNSIMKKELNEKTNQVVDLKFELGKLRAQLDGSDIVQETGEVLTAEQYEDIKEQSTDIQEKTAAMEAMITTLRKDLVAKDEEIAKLRADLSRLESSVAERRPEGITVESDDSWKDGILFRVQIGAYKDYDFSSVVGSAPDLNVEEVDGLKQYTAGNFRDYDEANLLKKHLRKVGVSDAWIVSYKDGNRVPLKDVLNKVLE
ncbi:hypothetical protein [Pararhodonellum marinum]|uniref:hypothetical protein n=1 Tax=Pararhodonellum marinum TaxID=2755358 RepID=UPI001890851E|nr:hypothetical protein [Pararhodonellum marinum]